MNGTGLRAFVLPLRAWAAVHEWRTAAWILILSLTIVFVAKGDGLQNLGMLSFPEVISYWLLLPVLWGIAVSLALDYRGPAHIVVRQKSSGRLLLARAGWLFAWLVAAVLCCMAMSFIDKTTDLSVAFLNLTLFSGIGLSLVIAGFPQVAWLVPAALTLVAMGFGFPEHAASDVWYPWASFLSSSISSGRIWISVGVLLIPSVCYLLGLTRQGNATGG